MESTGITIDIRYYSLDKDNKPVPSTLSEWGAMMNRTDRVLAKTTVGNQEVSTVFLGMDHGFGEGRDPVLWETMVFSLNKHSGSHSGFVGAEEYQERYTSYEAAARGHIDVVMKLMVGEEL